MLDTDVWVHDMRRRNADGEADSVELVRMYKHSQTTVVKDSDGDEYVTNNVYISFTEVFESDSISEVNPAKNLTCIRRVRPVKDPRNRTNEKKFHHWEIYA